MKARTRRQGEAAEVEVEVELEAEAEAEVMRHTQMREGTTTLMKAVMKLHRGLCWIQQRFSKRCVWE
jgi:hypothetical protein